MLKSMRRMPVPQPPAEDSAWMIPSDVALFGRVEMSVFHGFGASKSPATVVVVAVPVVVVVVWLVVDVLELVDEVEVDVVLLVVVAVEEDVGRTFSSPLPTTPFAPAPRCWPS
jgi:hypothetical protein